MSSPILFLDDEFEVRVSVPDQQIISFLQQQISAEQNEERRLSLLWIALRELMSIPYTNLKDYTLLCQWNEILGKWASAKYSIAKCLFVKTDRNDRLNEALGDVQQALKLSVNSDDSGLRAIKGSIFRQLGRVTEAVSEYEAVLNIRQKNSASDASIGEALSELGFGYLRQWNLLKGLQYCKEGVALMRNGASLRYIGVGF